MQFISRLSSVLPLAGRGSVKSIVSQQTFQFHSTSFAMAFKVTYFDETWRAEPIRLILSAAGQKFEDIRIQEKDWPELKKKLEWPFLPNLQVGDKTLTQSKTIYRFLGRKFKMAGADDWEAARIDELVDALGDVLEEHLQIVWIEQDPKKKEERSKAFFSEKLPSLLTKFNKRQGENGGSWFVGKSMTWGDIVIAETIRLMTEKDPSIVNAYPNVKKVYDGVGANPAIKEFRNKHKK